jgi:hypothetical protein
MSRTVRIVIIAVAATVVLLKSSAAMVVDTPITSPRCKADPAAHIAALPAGATFIGSGCYATRGIELTKPITINGGTYDDPVNTDDVTIENVTANGQNTAGGYHGAPLVGEEGISVIASSAITLTNDMVNDTFGDGLYLGFAPRHQPDEDIAVNGYTTTNAGRQGLTVGYVNGAAINALTVNSPADTGVDFESDSSPTSGNITFTDLNVNNGGVWFQEGLSGPVIFNDAHVANHIVMRGTATTTPYPVTFTGGSLTINRKISGIPPAGIWINGPGRLSFTNVPISRAAGLVDVTGPAWDVENGGRLILNDCPTTAPIGVADSASRVVTRRSGLASAQ